jgi:hypothetical protein
MKINYKHTTYISLAVAILSLLVTGAVLAGNTDSPGPPTGTGSEASQMYTLEQVYDRLTTGAAATKMTAFTEPSSGPGTGTMHTLDDIWEATKSTHTRVPKTGQAGCWNDYGTSIDCAGTGQDGEYQLGVSPEQEPVAGGSTTGVYTVYGWGGTRFTDNGDGTVSDNLTGLIWLKNANCWGMQTWANALSNANGLASGSCGLSDGSSAGEWRLPNVNELHSLIDLTQSGPALPSGHPFTDVQSNSYWSSTTYASMRGEAWYVLPNDGLVAINSKPYDLCVWPVRSRQ